MSELEQFKKWAASVDMPDAVLPRAWMAWQASADRAQTAQAVPGSTDEYEQWVKDGRPMPAQVVPVLTDAEIDALYAKSDLEADPGSDYGCGFYSGARWAEQAVRAKLGAAGWLPIETAPKDGFDLLAHTQECGALVLYWDSLTGEADHWSDGMSARHRNPTHWMPLPPPPGIVGKEGA